MRRGGHVRYLLQQFHIFGMLAELVVADQRAERGTAENAVLFFVHLLEQRALVEFRRALQVVQEFLLAAFRIWILSIAPVSLWSIRYFTPRQDPSSFWKDGWCMISFN